MRDIKVVVEEIRGFCDLPMRPGDHFIVSGGKLQLPEDGHMCLWALGAMLPLLQLKQRKVDEDNDWVPTTDRISCPDPNGRVIFHIQPLEPEDQEGPQLPRRLIIDEERCERCGECVQACADARGHLGMESRIWVDEVGKAPVIPVVCRQCGNAPCVQACPQEALSRDPETKSVVVDEELCEGCRECRAHCRFDAIGDGPQGQPVICDLCAGDPACVQACPNEVILYGFGRELRDMG